MEDSESKGFRRRRKASDMSSSSFPSVVAVADLGEIRLTACPGLRAGEASAEALDDDLARIRASGATGLLSLIETGEFPLGIAAFSERVAAAGLEWAHLPIEDFGVPGHAFEQAYREMDLLARLGRGEVWAIHCRAGLGRTGTIAARLLVEAGLQPPDAIEAVRREHDRRAIETEDQQRYVLSFGRAPDMRR